MKTILMSCLDCFVIGGTICYYAFDIKQLMTAGAFSSIYVIRLG